MTYARPMLAVVEIVGAFLAETFLGWSPERPLWLRRLVQALWLALLALVLVVAAWLLVKTIESL